MKKVVLEKVVLAYSGGLDTSVICQWLVEQGYQVTCYVADLGQREDFAQVKEKAFSSGASKVIVEDLKQAFLENHVMPALGFNATYESRYLLGTSLARPLIAKGLIHCARQEGADFIAHGATGKGNDQVRFEISAYSLNPSIKIIAPWRMKEFYSVIKGRKEALDYAKKHKISVKATHQEPWSSDDNLYHISFEAGVLENPQIKPQEKMFQYTKSIPDAPEQATPLSIEFQQGIPVKINHKPYDLVSLLEYLNSVGGENAVGRIDIVESRFLGMKSRGVYETPGGTILYHAHLDLECLTLSRELLRLKNSLMLRFSDLVYNGFWFSEEMKCLLAFLTASQKNVSGIVHLELLKGNVIITGRESTKSLYHEKIASMEDDQGTYTIEDASGFIKINALNAKLERLRSRENQEPSQ